MALPRRRHHYSNRARWLVPAVSAASASLLLLFLLLSFLAPSPVDDNDRLLHHRHDSLINSGAGDAIKAPVFHVPNDGGAGEYYRHLWSSRNSQFYYGCCEASSKFSRADAITRPNRYLLIATSGGLNQQRTGITDAVVAARILNATLVVPKLDKKSFWKDSSNFSEIFNVDWFISHLAKDVKIIKELPLRRKQIWSPYTMRVPRKCNERCYINRVLPNLLKKHADNANVSMMFPLDPMDAHFKVLNRSSNILGGLYSSTVDLTNYLKGVLPFGVLDFKFMKIEIGEAVQLTKFDYRLANRLETDLQKLRCRVNYHALKFTDPILEMGQKLVQRMRMRSKHYIALHLRFEPDMLAFSGCYYGGGDKERRELGKIRKRWKTLHSSNPDKMRRQGRCPLTPEEVGLMLRALGYGRDVHIYVASGEVYGGEETLAPLKALFPNFHSKDTIASKEELAPFSAFSSRLAALDFIGCDESDVFVTNNNGNMAKILAGRRRYFGHKPTIRPNAKKLSRLFLNRYNMTWEEFASKVRTFQRGFMGEPKEVRPGRGEFHENPAACICEDSVAKAKLESRIQYHGKENNPTKKDGDVSVDDQNIDDEPEWSDPEDEEEISNPDGKLLFNGTNLDYDTFSPEEPELDEVLSD